MKNTLKIVFLLASFIFVSCAKKEQIVTTVTSPDKNIEVKFGLNLLGQPTYGVVYKNNPLIKTSTLGFDLKNAPAISGNFNVLKVTPSTFNEIWKMQWGEQSEVVNNYNELKIELQEKSNLKRKMTLVYRVFNDGIGFRYEFPEQPNLKEVIITDENTQFNLTSDPIVWWIPGDWDSYEYLYNTTKFSKINAISKRNNPNGYDILHNAVNTPVTMKTDKGAYMSFHEAELVDYAGMTLEIDTLKLAMKSKLVNSEINGYAVKRTIPFNTPWRTIQIADKPGDLITSRLILNLNEPNKLGDISSWFKPMKYVGIWWEMHLGKSTWDYESTQDMSTFTGAKKAKGQHGATTENAKYYIDFAAKNNIHGILVEGWNTGWKHWIGFDDREGVFDFVTPYPDYNLKEVAAYGKSKGVELIIHNETSAAPRTYDKQMDTAYALIKSLNLHAIKSGYVGRIIPKGEHHHGQWMVNHYNNAVIKAAKYEIAVDTHEPIKDTGLRRTYPNWIAREGLRGQEFNAWSVDGGNPPDHTTIVPFTRMLAGPIDFTPGIFNISLKPYKANNQVNTTLAKQLALYIIIYSPIQMAADLPEYYEDNPAFQFIKDVGVDWQETRVLNAEIGQFITIARKEKNSENWFVGGITNKDAREMNINFDFLSPDTTYETIFYEDGPTASYNKNPTSYVIHKEEITNQSKVTIKLATSGGFAISIKPIIK